MIAINARFTILTLMINSVGISLAMAQEFHLPRNQSPLGARVFFMDLADGANVTSRFTVHFGAENIAIAPAGDEQPGSGHYHVLIDSPMPALDAPIPSDANHLHFGLGQTEAEIILPAGDHTLQLVLGDYQHVPLDPNVASQLVRVHVDPATIERARTPAPANAKVFFTDLKDGMELPTHAVIKFGLVGLSLARAGAFVPNSGHHHLLIDTSQPPLDREIPSDANHLHFGLGQSEAKLELTPGPHTLQLLIGDYQHVPHDPPIMSPQIHVIAVERKSAAAASAAIANRAGLAHAPHSSPPDAAVYFIYPTNKAIIHPRSVVRIGLRNMGVAPAGVDVANTGHHHLLVDVDPPPPNEPIPSDFNHIHFSNGETEKKIRLPPGKHRLQLVLGDDQHFPHDPPVVSKQIVVTVVDPGRKRRRF
jgi:Domain of unknown function (DUF4399)